MSFNEVVSASTFVEALLRCAVLHCQPSCTLPQSPGLLHASPATRVHHATGSHAAAQLLSSGNGVMSSTLDSHARTVTNARDHSEITETRQLLLL